MNFDKQRALRHYLFRSLVAELDMRTKGPMVLTWTEARRMWKGATVASETRKPQRNMCGRRR